MASKDININKEKDKQAQNFIEKPILGIEQNYQNEDNPSNVCTFALNAILENDNGKVALSRENSNLKKQIFTSSIKGTNYQVVGFIYGENNIVYYFLSNGTNSEIGYTDENNVYHSVVNFDDLNFKIENQISGVYRLRLGCEKTIYWTEQNHTAPIRYFNFNKEEYFKDEDGNWDINSFSLFYNYIIPSFENVEVVESGLLCSGSYNIGIQLLDENLNGTPWLQTTNPIPVYSSKLNAPFHNIHGSSNYESDVLGGSITHAGKSIKVEVGNLDSSFSYYRLALIEASSFNKEVTKIYTSNPIPITQTNYIFTGNPSNTITGNVSEEDIKKRFVPFTAESLEQQENRLIATNLRGKQYNFCEFQKYASKIASGYFVGEANYRNVNSLGNPKNPKTSFVQLPYHGFEVYAFGIVYVFPDFETPAYHIPGRPKNKYWDFDTNTVVDISNEDDIMPWNTGEVKPFTDELTESGYNALPNADKVQKWEIRDTSARIADDWGRMAYFENKNFNYLTKDNCEDTDYWGVDFDGETLTGKPIRHHRFPSRRTEPQVTLNGSYTEKESLNIKIYFNDSSSVEVPCCGDSESSCVTEDIYIYVTYDKDTIAETYTSDNFSIEDIDEESGYSLTSIDVSTNGPNAFENVNVFVKDCEGNDITIEFETEYSITKIISDNTSNVINLLGVQFSNIEYPHPDIIGHYIVVAERDEFNRTILESGFAKGVSSLNTDFMNYGFFSYLLHSKNASQKYLLSFFPSFYFKNSVLKADYLRLDLHYNYNCIGKETIEYKVKEDGQKNASIFSRMFVPTSITSATEQIYDIVSQKEFNALSYDDNYIIGRRTVNHSQNNKVLLNELGRDFPHVTASGLDKLPYVSLCVNRQIHTDLFNITYYRTHPNLINATSETYKHKTYGGDTYISDFQFNNAVLYHTKEAGWKIILLVVATVLAIALTVASFGGFGAIGAAVISTLSAVLGASTLAIGTAAVCVTLAAAIGVTSESIKYYRDNFKNHLLKDTLQEDDYGDIDDEVSTFKIGDLDVYVMEGIFNTYVDNEMNLSLKQDFTGVLNTSDKGSTYKYGTLYSEYARKKILIFDDENSTDNNQYWYNDGTLGPEIYHYNPDYSRKNFQTVFFSLPFTYDCCSDCLEVFEGRTAYSEQSFQEELVDHYRVFLPNNYRDLEGGTGKIKNIFKKDNKLYLHTTQALWEQPANFQMQNTSDLVTYLGTGEFFSIPPQKVLDDQNSVFGTEHKWSLTKSKYGYLFVSEAEKRIYLFQEQPSPISLKGIKGWSEEEIPLVLDIQWLQIFNEHYPLNDNPYNQLGIGYISTFDNKFNRYLITKKDFRILNPSRLFVEDVYEYATNNYRFDFIGSYNQYNEESEDLGRIGDLIYSEGMFYKIVFVSKITSSFCVVQPITLEDSSYFENKSWTLSYSVIGETWVSWHSYLPNIYVSNNSTFFSIINKPIAELYEHNIKYDYCNFYGEMKPFITEVVFNNPLQDFTWEYINLHVRAINQDLNNKIFRNEPYEFFNKVIFYNDYQSTGLKNVKTKRIDYGSDYMMQQVKDVSQEIQISKEEGVWYINDIRNYITNNDESLFTRNWNQIFSEYPIDKVVNDNIIDHNKTWQELEMLRGKYLTMRLIYDGTKENQNKQLIFNYTLPYNIISYR